MPRLRFGRWNVALARAAILVAALSAAGCPSVEDTRPADSARKEKQRSKSGVADGKRSAKTTNGRKAKSVAQAKEAPDILIERRPA
ncbi:MAG: hypothetical protein WD176_09195, partial [Pirellulales bacterium]